MIAVTRQLWLLLGKRSRSKQADRMFQTLQWLITCFVKVWCWLNHTAQFFFLILIIYFIVFLFYFFFFFGGGRRGTDSLNLDWETHTWHKTLDQTDYVWWISSSPPQQLIDSYLGCTYYIQLNTSVRIAASGHNGQCSGLFKLYSGSEISWRVSEHFSDLPNAEWARLLVMVYWHWQSQYCDLVLGINCAP